jgi:hypothetical protein
VTARNVLRARAAPSVALVEKEFNATMINNGMRCRITFDDDGPDHLGRRRFTLEWNAHHEHGERRGQCFFSQPALHVEEDGDG